MGLCVIVSTHICKLLGRCIHMNRKKFISRNPREHIQYPKTKDITIDDPPQINKKDKEKVYPVIIQCIVAIMNFSLISLIISKDIPVGIDALGKQFEFDLHEVEAGPHCIVAGSTGSGKSEFLTTMILSFAINYPPEKISFWIFDGKGGGLIAPLENLPHISKSVTQLDESVFVEVTHSLKDELIRRQVLLRQYGGDFESYNAVNNCSLPPLPHLFIIVDEFAEIKRYYPEFMDSLMSAVRVGRSLGIHLVLSTQKPAGVVNDQILANCRSKICLRTYAEADSLEILGDSIATTFINSGRAAIRVGNDMISVFQTFWSHAGSEEESVPQSKALVEYISKIYSIYCSK